MMAAATAVERLKGWLAPSAGGRSGPVRAFAPFEWMLAWRYLRAKRKEAFISVIAGFSFVGILLGVATLIVVMGVMNGFRQELLSKILGLNGHVVMTPTGDLPFNDYNDIANRIAFVKGVDHVVSFAEGQALASGPNAAVGILLRGMTETDLSKLSLVYDNVKAGSLKDFDQSKGVAIGKRLADRLGLEIGQPVTIVTPRGNVTPLGVTPRTKAYPVAAIFSVGMSEYDGALVYMPMAEAQSFLNLDDQASAVEVYLKDPDSVRDLAGSLRAAAERPMVMVDWTQRNATFFSALSVQSNVMFMILSMIILVAALNIISGLTMLVKDKSHDIGILRTMGATQGSILRVFFINGAAIGMAGTLAGVSLGLLIGWQIEPVRQFVSWITGVKIMPQEVYFVSRLVCVLSWSEVIGIILMALGLSFLATIYPAWKAARLDPVDALRYE